MTLNKYCKTWLSDIWYGKYLCAEKIPKFSKILVHAKISCFTVDISENMFFYS